MQNITHNIRKRSGGIIRVLRLVYGVTQGILLLLPSLLLLFPPAAGALPGALPAGGITGLPPDGVVTFPTSAPPGPLVLDPG
ncbi:MAG TPA: hypothetical protein VFJ51_14625 [Nitrososphaeraceae archaeon]|nr:hypothetical protein [Nitrososphaeraceae archaeon]